MERERAAWRIVSGLAGEMESLSSRLRGEKRKVARLAAMVLETVADRVLRGEAGPGDVERLEELAGLLRLYGLPTGPIARAVRILLRTGLSPGPEPVVLEGGIIALA